VPNPHKYDFEPEAHRAELEGIYVAVEALDAVDDRALRKLLGRFPKNGREMFSKSELIRGVRHFADALGWDAAPFARKLRMKPIRTASGVAPVTVLTKPFPCPGRCIFCPNDVRMPKSYLAMEPGAQRAMQNKFDPYAQTMSRLHAFFVNGHVVDKVELIVLGGTWSFYPEPYQIWFIKRCFDAMNDFVADSAAPDARHVDFERLDDEADRAETYNRVVSRFIEGAQGAMVGDWESATWDELEAAHADNESASSRCVGLVLETRPDHIDLDEVKRIRRLGATKVQIGYQALDDAVLAANRRGHDVAATRRAMHLLRSVGFKIHAHWMPNLYGSDVERDAADFVRIFDDPDFRPDELKLYPTSLIETAELMERYRDGTWVPYDDEALVGLLERCMVRVPRYCRLTRVIRDIPSHDIVVGNKTSNLREVAEARLRAKGATQVDIRSREIRGRPVQGELTDRETRYDAAVSEEVFLEAVTEEDRIVGFLRLSLPKATEAAVDELQGAAIIREVHVYGAALGIGERSQRAAQHAGLGRRFVERACVIAAAEGFARVAVISAIGTRGYYRSLGFTDGQLYQLREV
jgi:elongator complex protein 3